MRQQRETVSADEDDVKDDPTAARKDREGPEVRVHSISVIETRSFSQLTNGTWNAVVTSGGKGTFLIRRQKDPLSGECPLLCYDVRNIDGEDRHTSGDQPAHDHRRAYDPETEPVLSQGERVAARPDETSRR